MDTPDKPATAKVRLSIWPDRDTEVPADEVPALRSQGLLLSVDGAPEPGKEPAPQSPPAVKPAAASSDKGAAK